MGYNGGAGLSGKRWLIYVAGKRQEEGTVSERRRDKIPIWETKSGDTHPRAGVELFS